jgi:hypothetical protein
VVLFEKTHRLAYYEWNQTCKWGRTVASLVGSSRKRLACRPVIAGLIPHSAACPWEEIQPPGLPARYRPHDLLDSLRAAPTERELIASSCFFFFFFFPNKPWSGWEESFSKNRNQGSISTPPPPQHTSPRLPQDPSAIPR